MSLIDSGVYQHGRRIAAGLEPAEAVARAREVGGVVWIGLRDTDAAELAPIAERLGLARLAVRDCLTGHQRSKFEQFGEMLFVVLQPATYHDDVERVKCSEVDLFIGHDFIVSVQDGDVIDVDDLRRRLEERPEILDRGPLAVLWAILEDVIDKYQPVLDGVENDIDEIEVELFDSDPDVSRRIFKLQREVIELQHATAPLVGMLDRLQGLVAERTGQGSAAAFRDVDDRAAHVVDRVDSFRHTLESALKVHATLVEQANNEAMRRMTEFSLQQNDQVKKVSSWAAILFAPTLVGTIYGMNFDNMPELHWTFGYPIALALMLATSLTLFTVFKRKDWL